MTCPNFVHETIAYARQNRVWALAFVATLLMPLMLIVARVGVEICCALIGLAFLWHSARTRDWQWLRDPFTLACLVAWGWLVLVVAPLAVAPSSKWPDAALWFRFPLMFAALRFWVLAYAPARLTLASMLALLLALVVVDTFWQMLTGVSLSGQPRIENGRLTGPFETPKVAQYLGKLVMPAVAICIAAALALRLKRPAMLAVVLLVASIVMILLSGQRSTFLTVLLGCGVMGGLMLLRDRRLLKPCLLAGALVIGGFFALYTTNDWVKIRSDQGFETMLHYPKSDYGVLAIAGIDMGKAHWLHGTGLRGFRDFCPDLPYNGYTFRGMHPHNAFVEWFAETGAIGLLLFITMIGVLLRDSLQHFRAARGLDALLPAAAIGILAQHFFPLMGMQSFFTNWPAMLQWFPLAMMFAALPPRRAR
jgi:O-antigen ligase